MTEDLREIRDELAYLRALASERSISLTREGALLFALAPVDFLYWLLSSGGISLRGLWQHAPWVAGTILFLICLFKIKAKVPRTSGVSARAIGAASASVGFGITAALPALILGAFKLHQPSLVAAVFPIVVLTLYGAVWTVVYAVKRRPWFVFVAIGCFAAIIACGLVMGEPQEWLVLAIAMILLVATPGAAMIRQSRAEA
jgi:hypothetical protein